MLFPVGLVTASDLTGPEGFGVGAGAGAVWIALDWLRGHSIIKFLTRVEVSSFNQFDLMVPQQSFITIHHFSTLVLPFSL